MLDIYFDPCYQMLFFYSFLIRSLLNLISLSVVDLF